MHFSVYPEPYNHAHLLQLGVIFHPCGWKIAQFATFVRPYSLAGFVGGVNNCTTWGVSVYSADVDSQCLSPHLGCRWLAAVLFDTCAAAALIVCKQT